MPVSQSTFVTLCARIPFNDALVALLAIFLLSRLVSRFFLGYTTFTTARETTKEFRRAQLKRAMANDDIEMGRVQPKRGGPPEETDYKPINWKRIFFTPKYIRTSPSMKS